MRSSGTGRRIRRDTHAGAFSVVAVVVDRSRLDRDRSKGKMCGWRIREKENACGLQFYHCGCNFSCCLLSIVKICSCRWGVHFVYVSRCRRFRELPLTATHIYNRTENKTTAVTYKVSISIHQYWRFILSLARFKRFLAHTLARSRVPCGGRALFQADLWVRPILYRARYVRAPRLSTRAVARRRREKECKVRGSSRG